MFNDKEGYGSIHQRKFVQYRKVVFPDLLYHSYLQPSSRGFSKMIDKIQCVCRCNQLEKIGLIYNNSATLNEIPIKTGQVKLQPVFELESKLTDRQIYVRGHIYLTTI
jgi:hypothetical protein